MSAMTVMALPPLHQSTPMSRPYRLFTVEHCTFDQYPPYAEGGPGTCTVNGWHVSYSKVCRVFSSQSVVAADDGMTVLSLTRRDPDGTLHRHPLDGTRFARDVDAHRAAFEAGALAFFVYEDRRVAW